MKIPYFCCIGAELKRYAKDFDFMNQVYLYKVPTDDSIDEVLAEDYFKAISDSVLQDDIVYVYEASAETLHECRFNKQNGHITAVPLASDETLTGAVTTIIHDNLTKNRAVISNGDGKVAVSNVTSTELGYLSGATSNIQTQLNNKASKDLDNLTSKGANIANWSSNVTNCITEIPQDIKLTLSSAGQLKLLAGSKLYVPNGDGVFTEIPITSDTTRAAAISSQSVEVALFNKADLTFAQLFEVYPGKVCSGTTDTLAGQSQHLWYDTTNNLIKYYGNDGVTNNYYAAFPLGLVTGNGSQITSIDQVFNGFGYIGSTVFALPGVKVLTPDGFNADGTLKNRLSTSATVNIKTLSSTCALCVNTSLGIGDRTTYYVVKNKTEMLNINASGVYYVTEENLTYSWSGGSSTMYKNFTYIGSCQITSGKITYFSINKPFHAVDYSDTEFIAHQAMPSGRYVDLTLGSSGNSYTAPADGYITLIKISGAGDERIQLYVSGNNVSSSATSTATGQGLRAFVPVKKGNNVVVLYSATSSTNTFRFVYANGAK